METVFNPSLSSWCWRWCHFSLKVSVQYCYHCAGTINNIIEPEPGSLGSDSNVQNQDRSAKQSEKRGYQLLSVGRWGSCSWKLVWIVSISSSLCIMWNYWILWWKVNLPAVHERKIPVSRTSRGQCLNAWLCLQHVLFLAWIGSDSGDFINLAFHCRLQQKTEPDKGGNTRRHVCVSQKQAQPRSPRKGVMERNHREGTRAGGNKKRRGAPLIFRLCCLAQSSACAMSQGGRRTALQPQHVLIQFVF